MCGIVGALAYGTKDEAAEQQRQTAMQFCVTELLELTLPRGKDATGISTLFNNGDVMGLKMGVSPVEFVHRFGGKREDYEGYMKIWKSKASPSTITIGHCRKPSTGTTASADDNANNHPIKVGKIIGVHNGTLTNHDQIFKNLNCGRDGKVDSEAIFRLLHHMTDNGSVPFTQRIIQETCKRLSGSYAVLAMNTNNPYQLAAFRDTRPIEVAIIKKLCIVLIASEKEFLKQVCLKYNKMAALYDANFPVLTKTDVEMETLIDDSLYLFDLTREITASSKISDLYDTEKVPRTEKIWTVRATTTTTHGIHGVYGANASHLTTNTNPHLPATSDTKTSDTTSSNCSPANSDTANKIGMAWSEPDKTFVPVQKLNEAKNLGNVVIDCGTSGYEEFADKKRTVSTTDSALEKASFALDDLVSSEAVITVCPIVEESKHTTNDKPKGEPNATNEQTPSTVTIDMSKPSKEAVDMANSAVKKLEGFTSNSDLAKRLEMEEGNMVKMPIYALSNRLMRFFFRFGFEKGFAAGKSSASKTNDVDGGYSQIILSKYRKKATASVGIIRTLKGMLFTFAELCPDTVSDNDVKGAISNVANKGFIINPNDLNKIIRPGDSIKNSKFNSIISRMKE